MLIMSLNFLCIYRLTFAIIALYLYAYVGYAALKCMSRRIFCHVLQQGGATEALRLTEKLLTLGMNYFSLLIWLKKHY